MRKVLFSFIVLLLFAGCERGDFSTENSGLEFRAGNKVAICHLDGQNFFHEIEINQNALPAHLDHGDYLQDEECGCFPMGLWNGTVVYSNGWTVPIHVTFDAGHSATVVFGDEPCPIENGVTWALQACDGDSFNYLESDPCSCSGCEVIVEKGIGVLYLHYTCYCGGTWMIEGTLYPS